MKEREGCLVNSRGLIQYAHEWLLPARVHPSPVAARAAALEAV